jgi:hypothetical protein
MRSAKALPQSASCSTESPLHERLGPLYDVPYSLLTGGFDQARRNRALQSESACDLEGTLTAFDNSRLPF